MADADRIRGIHRGRRAVRDSRAVDEFERDAQRVRRGRRTTPEVNHETVEGALDFLLRNVPGLRQELDKQDSKQRG